MGWIGAFFPQTLFWGDKELVNAFSLGAVPPPQLPPWMVGIVSHTVPYDIYYTFAIALLKFIAIGIGVASGMPGGVIFPLFYAGAMWGDSIPCKKKFLIFFPFHSKNVSLQEILRRF